jgi:hypothetical protein
VRWRNGDDRFCGDHQPARSPLLLADHVAAVPRGDVADRDGGQFGQDGLPVA